jgi:hypothetical protein
VTTFFFGLSKINNLRSKYLDNCGSWANGALHSPLEAFEFWGAKNGRFNNAFLSAPGGVP